MQEVVLLYIYVKFEDSSHLFIERNILPLALWSMLFWQLTQWNIDHEKLIIVYVPKKFPAVYGT